MVVPATYGWPERKKCLVSLLMIIPDMIVIGICAVAMVFVMCLFTGLDPDNYLKFAPICQIDAAVVHVYISRVFTYPTTGAWFRKQSRWVAFAAYYGTCWTVGVAMAYAEYYCLKFVWYQLSSGFEGMVSMHQLLTFVVLTSHNVWFGGEFLKGAHPLSSVVIQFFVTWIVWGIWVHNSFAGGAVDNLGQMGGYLLWIPLTNLFPAQILHDMPFNKIFKGNLKNRIGGLMAGANIINICCWAIAYGLSYGLSKDTWSSINKYVLGHGIQNLSSMTLIPMFILGHRVSPFVFKRMCLTKQGDMRWIRFILYMCLMAALCLGLGTVLFIFFNRFMWDILICDVIKAGGGSEKCRAIIWQKRPTAYLGFGVGMGLIAFVEGKEYSRDGYDYYLEQKEKSHADTEKLEGTVQRDEVSVSMGVASESVVLQK